MGTFVARTLAVGLLLVGLFAAGAAEAQPSEAPPEALDPGLLDEEARTIFEAGRLAYAGGRFDNALEYFERAYALSQRSVLLFNIGAAADRLRRDDRALEAFEAYLEAMPEAPNAAQVRSRIRVIRGFVDRELSDQEPSDHELSEEDDAARVEPAEVERQGDASADPSSSPNISLVVVGGLTLAGAVGSAVYWFDRAGTLGDCGSDDGVACLNTDTLERQRNAGIGLTIGLAALGGALFSLGLVMGSESEDSRVSLECGAAGLGLLCRGVF